jgi:hypothetical protein
VPKEENVERIAGGFSKNLEVLHGDRYTIEFNTFFVLFSIKSLVNKDLGLMRIPDLAIARIQDRIQFNPNGTLVLRQPSVRSTGFISKIPAALYTKEPET